MDPDIIERLAQAELQPTMVRVCLLRALKRNPMTPKMAWECLCKEYGIDITDSNVRYHLRLLADKGVVQKRGPYFVFPGANGDAKVEEKTGQKTILLVRATVVRR